MSPIRVLVVDLPALHRDIVVRIVAEQPDMAVVGWVPNAAEAVLAEADVLLLNGVGALAELLDVIRARPDLGAVILHRESILELRHAMGAWPHGLIEGIRQAAAS
ncbi:hypothetical protein HII36_08830 [Nonomuraea sp. NN258]|uniref:hypothetical protein n=1 Tax=Nonomuraea antri TaxID=2730852 RepID=UPI00156A2ED1|nr:hypothetical protein [Nonomuraea antri]NRQ31943.1 hypothetical protein [Nonomuraea antri]